MGTSYWPPGLHLLVKWSKTMQSKNTVKIVKIPSLGKNPICPVQAIKNLLAITPGSQNSPLFQYKNSGVWIPMTHSQVRAHFKILLKKLNMHQSSLTFHAFQRSGATFAFNANVDLQAIHSHGTWTSECVWRYINASDQVASTFKRHLHTTT